MHSKEHSGNIAELPGRQSEEQWLGISFGMAEQLTQNLTGLFAFRPQIWFQRFRRTVADGLTAGLEPQAYVRGQFAVAAEDHWFAVERSAPDGTEQRFERFVGGRGRP
jgi:hypothetical protein